jgi:hypothetical protein
VNPTKVKAWKCGSCGKLYPYGGKYGEEVSKGCCACKLCGMQDKSASLFKVCRLCDLKEKKVMAEQQLKSAAENLGLYNEWIHQEETRRKGVKDT